jgi:hypothetical protein
MWFSEGIVHEYLLLIGTDGFGEKRITFAQ